MAENGDARVPQTHRTADGFGLGRWVHLHRQNRKQRKLTTDQIAALDALGFVWESRADNLTRGLAALKAYPAEDGQRHVPTSHRTSDGFDLGGWANRLRAARRSNGLTQEQIDQLEALGFVWEPLTAQFTRGLAALRAYVHDHGHGRVPRGHRTADGFRLGEWVNSRRYERRKGELTAEQITRLDAAGMDW